VEVTELTKHAKLTQMLTSIYNLQ